MQDKPCVPQSPYPHQFTHSFPFLTCKYICSEISPPGWQVQARLRCKCSPSCAKTSCGEHHVQPNRSAKIHLFTRFFFWKDSNTGWLFPQQNALGLTIELLSPGVGPPERFAGQVLVNVPEVKVLEVTIFPKGSQSEDVMLDVPEEGAIEGLQGSWYIYHHISTRRHGQSLPSLAASCLLFDTTWRVWGYHLTFLPLALLAVFKTAAVPHLLWIVDCPLHMTLLDIPWLQGKT